MPVSPESEVGEGQSANGVSSPGHPMACWPFSRLEIIVSVRLLKKVSMDLPGSEVPISRSLPGESELIVPASGVFAHHQFPVSPVHLGVGAITGVQGFIVSSTMDHTILVSPSICTVAAGLQDWRPVLIIAADTGEHLVCRVRGVRRVGA